MKKFSASTLLNFLLAIIILGLLFNRGPIFIAMLRTQGQSAVLTEVSLLDHSKVVLPLPRKHLVVFWATWCSPCKMELGRINSLIKSGKLKAQDVIAISSGENPDLVRDHVAKNNYQFTVGLDPTGHIAKLYKVAGTPTLILVDQDGKVNWMTMGLSPTLEIRLTSFFKN